MLLELLFPALDEAAEPPKSRPARGPLLVLALEVPPAWRAARRDEEEEAAGAVRRGAALAREASRVSRRVEACIVVGGGGRSVGRRWGEKAVRWIGASGISMAKM